MFVVAILVGCESTVDFPEIPTVRHRTVIEATLTNRLEVQKVRVSKSTPLNDSLSSIPVTSATVLVSSDAGDTVIYTYTNDGWYASPPYYAVEGRKYTLTVTVDTSRYRSIGELIPMEDFSSLNYKQTRSNSSVYNVYLSVGEVDPLHPKYYQLDLFKNDSLLTGGIQLGFFSDEYLYSHTDINISEEFAKNDTAKVYLYTISEVMYNYYYSLYHNILDRGLVTGYQVNPPVMFTGGALGYFQVSEKEEKTIVIEK